MLISIMMLLLLTSASAVYFYTKSKSMCYPGVLFNILWFFAAIFQVLNINKYYPISEQTGTIILIGVLAFNIPLYLKKRAIFTKREMIEIDYAMHFRVLFYLQCLLFITCVPIVIRAIPFIMKYGIAFMRNIYADSISYGYLSTVERLIYIHFIIFPLIKACTLIQLVALANGKCKIYSIIPTVLNQVSVFIITVGRNDLIEFIIWAALAYALARRMLRRNASSNQILSKKNVKKMKKLIAFAAVGILVISIVRHRMERGSIIASLLGVVSTTVSGGMQLLDLSLSNPTQWHLDHYVYGLATFKGILDVINNTMVTLSRGILRLPEFYQNAEIQTVAAEFHYVSDTLKMNAYMTMFYYFLRDFGYVGLITFPMAFSNICHKSYKKCEEMPCLKNETTFLLVMTVLLFSTIWWEPINSTFVMTIFWCWFVNCCIERKWFGKRIVFGKRGDFPRRG